MLTMPIITVTMTSVNDSLEGLLGAIHREIFNMTKYLELLRNDFQGNADALIV